MIPNLSRHLILRPEVKLHLCFFCLFAFQSFTVLLHSSFDEIFYIANRKRYFRGSTFPILIYDVHILNTILGSVILHCEQKAVDNTRLSGIVLTQNSDDSAKSREIYTVALSIVEEIIEL